MAIALVLVLILCAASGKRPARAQASRPAAAPHSAAQIAARSDLIDAITRSIDSLDLERERLERAQELAVTTHNDARAAKAAKRLDAIAEQIARKRVQIATLQQQIDKARARRV